VFNGVRLGMAVTHGDLNRAMPRNTGQREGVATCRRKVGQCRVAKAVRLERFNLWMFFGLFPRHILAGLLFFLMGLLEPC